MSFRSSPGGDEIATDVFCGLDNLCSIYRYSDEMTGWETKLAVAELHGHEGYISTVKFLSDNEIFTASAQRRLQHHLGLLGHPVLAAQGYVPRS